MKAILLILSFGLLLGVPLAVAETEGAKSPTTEVTPEAAQKVVAEKKDLVILDVRTPEEFQAGHLAGAQNLNFQASDFQQKIEGLSKEKTYLVYCAAGSRSGRVVKKMEAAGFKDIQHMNGGFSAWQQQSKPIEK